MPQDCRGPWPLIQHFHSLHRPRTLHEEKYRQRSRGPNPDSWACRFPLQPYFSELDGGPQSPCPVLHVLSTDCPRVTCGRPENPVRHFAKCTFIAEAKPCQAPSKQEEDMTPRRLPSSVGGCIRFGIRRVGKAARRHRDDRYLRIPCMPDSPVPGRGSAPGESWAGTRPKHLFDQWRYRLFGPEPGYRHHGPGTEGVTSAERKGLPGRWSTRATFPLRPSSRASAWRGR